jgi:hypothetical protein
MQRVYADTYSLEESLRPGDMMGAFNGSSWRSVSSFTKETSLSVLVPAVGSSSIGLDRNGSNHGSV